jgi:hypothetical protein
MNRPGPGHGTGGSEGSEQWQQVLAAGLGLAGIGVLLPVVQHALNRPPPSRPSRRFASKVAVASEGLNPPLLFS